MSDEEERRASEREIAMAQNELRENWSWEYDERFRGWVGKQPVPTDSAAFYVGLAVEQMVSDGILDKDDVVDDGRKPFQSIVLKQTGIDKLGIQPERGSLLDRLGVSIENSQKTQR